MNLDKKKVGLVTWLGGGNYGTTLQSFALHEKLRLLGYDVYFLKQYRYYNIIKGTIKYIFFKISLHKLKMKNRNIPLKDRKLSNFIQSKYNIKDVYLDYQFKKMIQNTDVFVTGSDQIWNTKYNFNPFMFLDFAGDTKRVAYASSIGLSYIPKEHKEFVKTMLSKFAHIGVREQTAVNILKEVVGRNDIQQVLDPTFLLTVTEWRQLCKEANFEMELPEKYIFCYLIGNNSWYYQQLDEVIKQTGIKNVIIIPSLENPEFMMDNAIVYESAGPIEFVSMLDHASFICTDSFHATALSIIMSKDFVEFIRFKDIDSTSQNSRIYDLLERYRLNERIYKEGINKWRKCINYVSIQALLEEDRQKSLEFLIRSIEF